MKITFSCSRCGKTLKARQNAAGQTRKCPVCATRVKCPRPAFDDDVVDAEIVDAEVVDAELVAVTQPVGIGAGAKGNPYADLDDDAPYQVVAPKPGEDEGSATEARRPCPMCGETILASAVKCRFCGEVFDAVLKKGKGRKGGKKSSRRSGSNPAAARDMGIGIFMLVLGLVLTGISQANPVPTGDGQGKYLIFTGLIFGGFGGIIRGIYGMLKSD